MICFYFDGVKKGDIQPVYSDKKEKKIDKEKHSVKVLITSVIIVRQMILG